ncbi:MAG: hypothetical protein V3T27_03315 [Alphaproteobacteria bacterium]
MDGLIARQGALGQEFAKVRAAFLPCRGAVVKEQCDGRLSFAAYARGAKGDSPAEGDAVIQKARRFLLGFEPFRDQVNARAIGLHPRHRIGE